MTHISSICTVGLTGEINVCGGHVRLRPASTFEYANGRSRPIETEILLREQESPGFSRGRSQAVP